MTHHDDPQSAPTSGLGQPGSGRETVSFGPGGASMDDGSRSDAHRDQMRQPGEVDAWYSEGEPDDGSTPSQPSWLSARWQGWQSLDRDRRIIIVLGAVTVVALLAAVIGIANRDDTTAIELPAVESHGLSPDEAACFAFGLIENRLEVRLDDEGFETSDPSTLAGPLTQEIQAIDNLAAEHPEADYRLITAFAAVADAGTTLSDTDTLATFRSAVSERAEAVAAATDACDGVAGFDVNDLQPN